jgi:hypothetical protein
LISLVTTGMLARRMRHKTQEECGITRICMILLVAVLTLGIPAAAQQPWTAEAFDRYVTQAEARIAQGRASSFLRIDALPAEQKTEEIRRLKQGEVVIEKAGETPQQVPDGLIHDWIGTVFIPAATVAQVISLVRDYDHSARYYSPDVLKSQLISGKGDDLHVFMRLQKQKFITVVLDTEYDVHYDRIDAAHQYSISRSTRVSEIADPGTPSEHALPVGHDHGFMWRLNSYWEFEQASDGVFVQCEAISLTRDIPAGLALMIGPFVNSIPKESLQFTLNATRTAVSGRSTKQD